MPKRRRKKRQSLWREYNKKCFWCNCETVFPESGSHNKPNVPNLATVEHLRSKFCKHRQTPNHNNEQRLVLACLACNSLRAKLEPFAVLNITVTMLIPSKVFFSSFCNNNEDKKDIFEVIGQMNEPIIKKVTIIKHQRGIRRYK